MVSAICSSRDVCLRWSEKTVTGIRKELIEEEREELQDLVSEQADVVEGGQCQSAQLIMLVLGLLTSELLTSGAQTMQARSASGTYPYQHLMGKP